MIQTDEGLSGCRTLVSVYAITQISPMSSRMIVGIKSVFVYYVEVKAACWKYGDALSD